MSKFNWIWSGLASNLRHTLWETSLLVYIIEKKYVFGMVENPIFFYRSFCQIVDFYEVNKYIVVLVQKVLGIFRFKSFVFTVPDRTVKYIMRTFFGMKFEVLSLNILVAAIRASKITLVYYPLDDFIYFKWCILLLAKRTSFITKNPYTFWAKYLLAAWGCMWYLTIFLMNLALKDWNIKLHHLPIFHSK